jgi:hypothetical protein
MREEAKKKRYSIKVEEGHVNYKKYDGCYMKQ